MSENEKEVQAEQQEPKHHQVGDLAFECGSCGNVEIMQKDIPGGISFILGTIEDAEVRLQCGKCNNYCTLYFKGMSDERDVEYEEKQKVMEEALKEQEILEAKKAELEAEAAVELTEEEGVELAAEEAEFLETDALVEEGEEVSEEEVKEEPADEPEPTNEAEASGAQH